MMTPETKLYLEQNIGLIENNNFEEFFENTPCDIFDEVYMALRDADIKFEFLTDFYIGYEINKEPEYLTSEGCLEDAKESAIDFIKDTPEIKSIYVGITFKDLVWSATIGDFTSSGKSGYHDGYRDITCSDGIVYRATYDDEYCCAHDIHKIAYTKRTKV